MAQQLLSDRIETTIISNLFFNEDFTRKALPFIKPEYFSNSDERILYGEIEKFVENYKSRITKENAQIDVRLSYKQGLDRHYGLLELGEEAGVFKKVSTRYELPDGTKVFGKSINTEPEKYFTDEVLTKIDEYTKQKFTYGQDEE